MVTFVQIEYFVCFLVMPEETSYFSQKNTNQRHFLYMNFSVLTDRTTSTSNSAHPRNTLCKKFVFFHQEKKYLSQEMLD